MALRPGKTILNHVLNLQRFSLANYLRFARPWTREADHVLLAIVFGIADTQQKHAARVGQLFVERHASTDLGDFPRRFTGLNDLSIRYLAPLVVEDLKRIIHDLRSCGDAVRDDRPSWELVQAILADEQRHLRILLEELNYLKESEPADQDLVPLLNYGTEQRSEKRRRIAECSGEHVVA